jgi:hypothetical protein
MAARSHACAGCLLSSSEALCELSPLVLTEPESAEQARALTPVEHMAVIDRRTKQRPRGIVLDAGVCGRWRAASGDSKPRGVLVPTSKMYVARACRVPDVACMPGVQCGLRAAHRVARPTALIDDAVVLVFDTEEGIRRWIRDPAVRDVGTLRGDLLGFETWAMFNVHRFSDATRFVEWRPCSGDDAAVMCPTFSFRSDDDTTCCAHARSDQTHLCLARDACVRDAGRPTKRRAVLATGARATLSMATALAPAAAPATAPVTALEHSNAAPSSNLGMESDGVDRARVFAVALSLADSDFELDEDCGDEDLVDTTDAALEMMMRACAARAPNSHG